MKKILILAYDFPPYVSAGGLRPHSWYLHLKKFGYDPIVISRQWESKHGDQRDYILPSASNEVEIEKTDFGTLIKTPYKPNLSQRLLLKHGASKFVLIRKSITFFFELAQYVFPVGPKKELYKTAKRYLSENKVDFILATGEPFVLFRYGSKLSRKFSVKWIADYRDPWSQASWRRSNFFMAWFNKRAEKKALKSAKAVSTVSNYVESIIRENIPTETPVHIQTNGFDSEVFKLKKQSPPEDKLVITFAGSVYPWHPLENVLVALNTYVSENTSALVEINLIGTNKEAELRNFISKNCHALEKVSKIQNRMSNQRLAEELMRSHLLLLFNDYAVIGTKIYNYLAAHRPILFCYTESMEAEELRKANFAYERSEFDEVSLQKELIEKTNSGDIVKNGDHLIELLSKYQEELSETGQVVCHSNSIEEYSRINQIKTFANFLDTL